MSSIRETISQPPHHKSLILNKTPFLKAASTSKFAVQQDARIRLMEQHHQRCLRGPLPDVDVEELAALLPGIIKNIMEERRLDRKVENWSL
ncbi:hypothetical protein N7455_007685 [Penicillium solitum]|uniref:Uncharacterized protein n=1 Tax=Penicillium solitum TaxID=60172 RepID=A0A1V6QWW2_9EURO|nr:uncharacterized protein PENSOL_c031G09728 [Penicillium solitum]KAF4771437.1 hypothetical protein HAV15_004152 [Penicillium sp. str. \